jgi:hypothetical protein
MGAVEPELELPLEPPEPEPPALVPLVPPPETPVPGLDPLVVLPALPSEVPVPVPELVPLEDGGVPLPAPAPVVRPSHPARATRERAANTDWIFMRGPFAIAPIHDPTSNQCTDRKSLEKVAREKPQVDEPGRTYAIAVAHFGTLAIGCVSEALPVRKTHAGISPSRV